MKISIRHLLFLASFLMVVNAGASGREVAPFNDGWTFKKGPFASDPVKTRNLFASPWQKVNLPHTWNASDMQTDYNKFYAGEAYYRKMYTAPADLQDKRLFLRFEGVGQVADLYVNGEYAGNHKGGYSAFAIEITRLLKPGAENEILLKASNASRPDVIPVNHLLFGVYGGIYRPVWLVTTDKLHIAVDDYASPGVYLSQESVSDKQADIRVGIAVENKYDRVRNAVIEAALYDQEGRLCLKRERAVTVLPHGSQRFDLDLRLKRPHLWNGRPDPYLYRVVCRVKTDDGTVTDEVIQPLGVRSFEMVAGKGFFLNGRQYPMYGVCRHQDWWGLGSALENRHHAADLATIMDLGATTVRFAHYQQSDYLYAKCDSLGLIIWAEIPFVNQVSTQEGDNAKEQLRELIRQNYNHPSIYVWGLHNEVYTPVDYTARLTRELHNLAKTEDPYRYTVSVNGYGSMDHPVNRNTDIQGMNRYFGWYEKKIQDILPWVEGLEKNYPDNRLILAEYGADANIAHQTEYLGESLNWTKPYYPETFQTKLHEYQWSVIASHPYIVASYLWNTFDFAVPMSYRGNVPARNMKGLVTFDRKIKKDAYYFYKANWSEEPVLYITQRRLKEREKEVTQVTVYSNIGQPVLTVNGREVSGVKKGYTAVHYIFDNVTLDRGENRVKATVVKEGKTTADEIVWNFSRERKAGEAEALNSDKEHVSF